MADVNLDTNLFFDMNWQNEDGSFGKYRMGYRDNEDHTIHFDEPAPEATPNATEAATRKADELGVDLAAVAGTGSGGQITVGDVEKAAS